LIFQINKNLVIGKKALENNYCTEYPKPNFKTTFKFGSHQNSIEGVFNNEKGSQENRKSKFNASMNLAKNMNLGELIIDIDSQECKLFRGLIIILP